MMKYSKKIANVPACKQMNGGLFVRYKSEWWFLLKGNRIHDFGGKYEDDETFEETVWREAREESGLDQDDVIAEFGVFKGSKYGVIVVEVSKEPVAKEAGTSIVRFAQYYQAKQTKMLSGRLFISGLEFRLREVESVDVKEPSFILDSPYHVDIET